MKRCQQKHSIHPWRTEGTTAHYTRMFFPLCWSPAAVLLTLQLLWQQSQLPPLLPLLYECCQHWFFFFNLFFLLWLLNLFNSSICPPQTAPCTDSIMELASEMKQWIRHFTHSSQVRYEAPEFWRTPKLLAPKPMRGNTSCMLLVPYWKRQTWGINKGNACVSITAQEAV